MAYDEYFPRALRVRNAPPDVEMAAAMQNPIWQISRRVVRALKDLTRSEPRGGNRSHETDAITCDPA